MICPNCKSECTDGSKFCTKCGASLEQTMQNPAPAAEPTVAQPAMETVTQPFVQPSVEPVAQPIVGPIVEPVAAPIDQPAPTQDFAQPAAQPITQTFAQPIAQPISQPATEAAPLNFFAFILAAIIKPFKAVKEESKKLADVKNSLLFSLITVASLTALTVLFKMLSVIVYKDLSGSLEFTFDYVGELDYFDIIWKNFVIIAGVVAGVAILFFVAARVIKKDVEFTKLLSISTVSCIPFYICSVALAPLFSYIWLDFSLIFTVIGFVYSVSILCTLINEEIKTEGDEKIYLNAICFSIMVLGAYYITIEILKASITSSLLNGIL